jgi:hypothetical protein
MHRMRLRFPAVAAASAATFLTAVPALADAAPSWSPGDPVGVPSGAVQDVFIEHEDLSMDLVGLNPSNANYQQGSGSRPSAAILAAYTLRNDGAAKGIDLVFITASREVSKVGVVFDGATIPAKVGPARPVPPSWKPPTGTPNPGGGPDLPYATGGSAGLAFHIELGAGRHTMATRYQAAPSVRSGNAEDAQPVWWQTAFVLSPARQWKGFGDLDVSVRVPSGWQAAVRPNLNRRGDVLSGHFEGIPADSIGVTARMQVPPDWRTIAWIWGMVAILFLSTVTGCVGARLIRWPVSLMLFTTSLAFPIALAIAVSYADYLRSAIISDAQHSWVGSRAAGITSLVQGPAAFVAGLVIGLIGLSLGIAIGGAWRRVTLRPAPK